MSDYKYRAFIRIRDTSKPLPPTFVVEPLHMGENDFDKCLRAMAQAVANKTGYTVAVEGLPRGTIFAPEAQDDH